MLFRSLNNNQISDLAPLSRMTNLKTLRIKNNSISDLSPLADLAHIEELNLDSNQISDLTPLASFVNLDFLSLDNNQVSDLAPLHGLTSLSYLYLYDNFIDDYSPVGHVKVFCGKSPQKEYSLIRRHPKQLEIDNEECICAICLNEYEASDEVSEIEACHHFFHQSCLQEWFKKSENCPFCRKSALKEKSLTDILPILLAQSSAMLQSEPRLSPVTS